MSNHIKILENSIRSMKVTMMVRDDARTIKMGTEYIETIEHAIKCIKKCEEIDREANNG
jgi:hypothetical protein